MSVVFLVHQFTFEVTVFLATVSIPRVTYKITIHLHILANI